MSNVIPFVSPDGYDPNYKPGKPELVCDPETGCYYIVVDSVDCTGPLDVIGERKRRYHAAWAEQRSTRLCSKEQEKP